MRQYNKQAVTRYIHALTVTANIVILSILLH